MPLSVNAALPEFDRVTVRGLVVSPLACFPKSMTVGFKAALAIPLTNGVDMSDAIASNGAVAGDVLHVIKASMDDDRHDYYALGRYDAAANAWTPLDAARDVGLGLRCWE